MQDCSEKFLTVCRTAAPGCPRRRLESLRYRSFHALWVGRRPMHDCPENFPKIFFLRLWKGPEPGTMLGQSNESGL